MRKQYDFFLRLGLQYMEGILEILLHLVEELRDDFIFTLFDCR